MIGLTRRRFTNLALGTGAAALAKPAVLRAQAAIELRLSHYLPPLHGIHTQFIEPWARELERRTGGAVKVTIFPGTAALGNVARQYDQVAAGIVDIAHGLSGLPRGRFPRTSVIDMPFLTPDAGVATWTLWALFPDHLAEEYRDVKVLALHAHNGGLIHTRNKPVRVMADLKGLRIRTPSPAVSSMLEYLGAAPVGLPPGQVYENLQKGAIDGTAFPWDPIDSFKLAEVLTHHLDARAYTVSFFFIMNRRKYDGLPAEIRAVIDDISGDRLIPRFGNWWNEWDRPGIEAAKARGNVITPLTPEERAAWVAALEPMIDGWLGGLEKDGVPNARAIYAQAQALVSRFENG
jgi:TRAP-type C4-dicarboxylate transport system substrate-binding protein